ncbi:MAG: hypothetical protein JXR37_27460 [Kiritimatiellae bacterium]|nr:hypothetical protein [Kiritimatiellia bacterium]
MRCIVNVTDYVKNLTEREKRTVRRMYDFDAFRAHLEIPSALAKKAREEYGLDPAELCDQRGVRIRDRYTFDETLFNETRSRRPLAGGRSGKDIQSLKAYIRNSKKHCDFCRPGELTAYRQLPRIERAGAVSAANLCPYDRNHGVLVFRRHDPHRISRPQLEDILRVAVDWCKQLRKEDRLARWPSLGWNCLWPAGASQVHGHAHMLALHQPSPWQRAAIRRRGYWRDWVAAHQALGLCRRLSRDYWLAACLTPAKEKELRLVRLRPSGEDWFKRPQVLCSRLADSLHLVLRFFLGQLRVRSFNVAVFFSPFENAGAWPLIVRLLDRGAVTPGKVKPNDMGILETLFGASVVSSDPFKLVEKFDRFRAKAKK